MIVREGACCSLNTSWELEDVSAPVRRIEFYVEVIVPVVSFVSGLLVQGHYVWHTESEEFVVAYKHMLQRVC